MSEVKKRKIEKEKPARLQCEYYLPKKNRRCGMTRKKDQRFCSEHMIHEDNQERIPCPLDPSHTVWTKDLQTHLKKCNARPKHDPWYELDMNASLNNSTEEKFEHEDLTEEELFAKYIAILKSLQFTPLDVKVSTHQGLTSRLEISSRQKHALQQSSLIGNLKSMGLLNPECFYIEFGCGKGELSRFVNLCILEDYQTQKDTEKYGFGFIDRGVNRLKQDNRILNDCKDSLQPKLKRTRIDIKDLNLDKFIDDIQPSKIVSISKHLCGAATDLTLKSLLNSNIISNDTFGGVLIAMCCRHVCSYDQLLPQSRQYLYDNGFKTVESFDVLKKLVSWAVSKVRPGETKSEENIEDASAAKEDVKYGVNPKERESIGLIARRLIDESRKYALTEILGEKYHVDIFKYIDSDTTLENVALAIV
ncbi:tRNA:m [Spathaspora sp. JA1]|nr:tRNA:m [Spathaspora sp. JA1]